MWIRTGVMVALLAAGCSKREEREPAPASAAPKPGAAEAPAVEDVDALRATMEDREAAGDDVGAAAAGDTCSSRRCGRAS